MRQGEGALSNKMVERVGADGASWILPDDYARKCSYIGCARKTSKEETYRLVREGAKAGGQDWGPLVGGVLCETCFECYCARGMLDKPGKLPHAPGRKCDYEGCLKPHGGSPYHLIRSAPLSPAPLLQPERHVHFRVPQSFTRVRATRRARHANPPSGLAQRGRHGGGQELVVDRGERPVPGVLRPLPPQGLVGQAPDVKAASGEIPGGQRRTGGRGREGAGRGGGAGGARWAIACRFALGLALPFVSPCLYLSSPVEAPHSPLSFPLLPTPPPAPSLPCLFLPSPPRLHLLSL